MPWEEQIILSNKRGAQKVFTRWIVHNIGGGGRFMYQFDSVRILMMKNLQPEKYKKESTYFH